MEFTDTVIRLTHSRYKLNEEISKEIASVVWHEMGTKIFVMHYNYPS
jgi:hypothetical protein